MTETAEDAGTLAYLEDTARQAGLVTTLLDIEEIGWLDGGGFVDLDDAPIELAFKLYPWEWMFREAFGARLATAPTRWMDFHGGSIQRVGALASCAPNASWNIHSQG